MGGGVEKCKKNVMSWRTLIRSVFGYQKVKKFSANLEKLNKTFIHSNKKVKN